MAEEEENYQIRWLMSRNKKQVAGFQSQLNPEMGYVFGKKSNGKNGAPDYYECLLCKRFGQTTCKKNNENRPILRTIRVSGNRFLTNPDTYTHVCLQSEVDTRWNKLLAEHHYYEAISTTKRRAEEGPQLITNALTAYNGMASKIRREEEDGGTINELAPPFKTAKRTFNKATAGGRIKVYDPRNIPDELKQLGTMRPQGLSAPGREELDDFFLLFEEQRENMPPMLIFSCLISLVFDVLANKLYEEFGNLGSDKTIIFDQELAAINAAQQIFNRPIDRTLSCFFHYSQNIVKKINELGLKTFWRTPELQKFVRELQGAVFLPPDYCALVFEYVLDNAPSDENSPAFNLGIERFSQYFNTYWRQPRNLELINQWNNSSQRTTNFSEGWHRCLARIFTMSHPPLGHFLQMLRVELLRHQDQARRLLRGAQIRLREAHVIQNEQRVNLAKDRLCQFLTENNAISYQALLRYSRHQARNCSTNLPLVEHEDGNDSVLVLNDEINEEVSEMVEEFL